MESTKLKKARSQEFIENVDHNSPDGQLKIADYRRRVKMENKLSAMKYRVVLCGRMGEDNPNAHLYRRNGSVRYGRTNPYQNILLEHAGSVDIYIYTR